MDRSVLLTLTADVLSVTAWSFVLKLCCNTFCCATDVKICYPRSFAVPTFALMPALIHVAMLRKLQLSLNGFRGSTHYNSSHESVICFPCLAVVKYLCCIIYLSANRGAGLRSCHDLWLNLHLSPCTARGLAQ